MSRSPLVSDPPTAPDPDVALSPLRRWAALGVLSASLLVITMDMTILNIALPEIAAELQPSSDQQLWIVSVYSLVLAGLLVSVAAIADRWGRRRMLVAGYAVFAVASTLVLIADSAGAVIAVRALLGIGGAMIMPTTLSMIRVVFTDARERATALSVWAAVSGLGAIIGPLVGGFLLERFSWHSAFLVNVPLMLVGIAAALVLLPESRVPDPGPWDGPAAALSLIGMISFVWALTRFGTAAGFAVSTAWAALVVGIGALGVFVVRSLRSEHPLLDLRLFRSRPFSAGILAAVATTFSIIAVLLLITQWLQLVEGDSPMEAGIRFMPIAVVGSFASLAAPPLSRIIGARTVLATGIGLTGVGLFYIGLAGRDLDTTHVVIALSLVGGGLGALAVGSALIMGSVSPDKAGNAGRWRRPPMNWVGPWASPSSAASRRSPSVPPWANNPDSGRSPDSIPASPDRPANRSGPRWSSPTSSAAPISPPRRPARSPIPSRSPDSSAARPCSPWPSPPSSSSRRAPGWPDRPRTGRPVDGAMRLGLRSG